jgi:hypothetical protein
MNFCKSFFGQSPRMAISIPQKLILLALLSSSSISFSEPSQETKATAVSDLTESPDTTTPSTKDQLKNFTILGSYSSYDLLVPGKLGVTAAYNESAEKTWELEYLSASISGPSAFKHLGSLDEKRISLLRRSFWNKGSFSGYFGLSWNSLEISLGNDLLAKLGVISTSKSTLLRMDTLGINTGIGNRWSLWKGFTIGSDWVGISQPLLTVKKNFSILDYATNQTERDRIESALKIAMFFPRLYLLKIQVGFTF